MPRKQKPEKKKKIKKDRRPFMYRFAALVTRIIFRPMFLNKYLNKNAVPKEGAYIVAGNHISNFDPIFLTLANRRPIRYMAKQELFKIKLIGSVCRSFGAIPVNRGRADIGSVEKSIEWLKTGKVFGIFVEGHRYDKIETKHGKAGAVFMAYKAGVPIIPFAVYSKAKNRVRLFCKYTAIFGRPITVAELGVVNGTSSEYRAATRRLMEIIKGLQDECAASRK